MPGSENRFLWLPKYLGPIKSFLRPLKLKITFTNHTPFTIAILQLRFLCENYVIHAAINVLFALIHDSMVQFRPLTLESTGQHAAVEASCVKRPGTGPESSAKIK